jgi:hypothetical protein
MRPARTKEPEDPRDVPALLAAFREAGARRGLVPETLGTVGDDPLLLLRPAGPLLGTRLLLAAGFHGEEPGGCWGLLGFLRGGDAGLFERASLSLLPAVNPTGLRRGRRVNDWGENSNRGFCHVEPGDDPPSREGRILLEHLPALKELGRDGFLSLHEDEDYEEFYLYTFEDRGAPGPFSLALREAERAHFRQVPDGRIDEGQVRDGILFRECDGSFEDRLFHEGVPRTACTETPGRLALARRIAANAAIADAFVRFHLESLPGGEGLPADGKESPCPR